MSWLDKLLGRRVINGDMTGGDVVGRFNNVGNISINGRSFEGNDIQIFNDRIIIDGVDVTENDGKAATGIVKIEIKGNVLGDATSGGSMNCGNIGGNARSNGSMNADNITGNAQSGGSMKCGKVGGSVTAGGSVRYG